MQTTTHFGGYHQNVGAQPFVTQNYLCPCQPLMQEELHWQKLQKLNTHVLLLRARGTAYPEHRPGHSIVRIRHWSRQHLNASHGGTHRACRCKCNYRSRGCCGTRYDRIRISSRPQQQQDYDVQIEMQTTCRHGSICPTYWLECCSLSRTSLESRTPNSVHCSPHPTNGQMRSCHYRHNDLVKHDFGKWICLTSYYG
jgi:hypothetical protein